MCLFDENYKKVMKKPYRFIAYDPYLTYKYKNKSSCFIDSFGEKIEEHHFHADIFTIGSEAFELLEIETEEEIQKLSKGYFGLVYILLSIAVKIHEEGKLQFNLVGGTEEEAKAFFKDALLVPTRGKLKHLAPSMFESFLTIAKDLGANEYKESDIVINMLDDVSLGCLAHILISIDDAVFSFNYETLESIDIDAIQSMTKCLVIAKSIIQDKTLKKIVRTNKAKFAAIKRHEKTKKAKEFIRTIWASGKYTSRDICAEQECANLNISFSTARKALRNTPNP